MPLAKADRQNARKIVELLQEETAPYLGHEDWATALWEALEAIIEGDRDAEQVAVAILEKMGES